MKVLISIGSFWVPGLGLSPIAAAIKALYGIVTNIDDYLDWLIEATSSAGGSAKARSGWRLVGRASPRVLFGFNCAVQHGMTRMEGVS
jgi:hypothetical protein